MRKLRVLVATLVVIAGGAAASSAWADPVQLMSGGLSFSSRFPAQITATGADGSVLRVHVGEHRYLGYFLDVTAGEPVDLSFSFSEIYDPASEVLFFGSLTRDGVITPLRALAFTISAGSILIPSSPIENGAIVEVGARTPFSFTGLATIEGPGADLRRISLTGTGTAGISLMGFNRGPIWFTSGYRFEDVAATPEPGSLLLFATGAAAVARLRRGRGKRAKSEGMVPHA